MLPVCPLFHYFQIIFFCLACMGYIQFEVLKLSFAGFWHFHSFLPCPDIFAIDLSVVVFHFGDHTAIPLHMHHEFRELEKTEVFFFFFAFLVVCLIVELCGFCGSFLSVGHFGHSSTGCHFTLILLRWMNHQ